MSRTSQQSASARIFEPGHNCWRVEKASRVAVLIDGENYFRNVRRAMFKAKKRIILMGWDFDARIKMHDTQQDHEGPLEIGRYINWLLKGNPDLQIYILRWNMGMIKSLFRGKTIFTMIRWYLNRRIHMKFDGKHPVGAAQHQKVIVIDDDVAFCGGIDITDGRWDTRTHDQDHAYREQPNDKDGGPWHDIAMAVQGPIARALGDFSAKRWKHVTGNEMTSGDGLGDCWPDELLPAFTDVDVAVARTQPEMDDQQAINEIEELYLDLIRSAKHHIYAESQYFASRKIARAIAERLEEDNGPEVVIVNPVSSEGWLEPEVMDTVRTRLFRSLKKRDTHDRFRLFHALNEAGNEIYIHAKIVIIDDRIIRVGSSNLNNRSLGFDTECDLAIDASDGPGGEDERTAHAIAAIRNDLLAEHLGCEQKDIAALMKRTGSLIETIQLSRGSGRTLRDYQIPDLNMVEQWLSKNNMLDPQDTDDNFAGIKMG